DKKLKFRLPRQRFRGFPTSTGMVKLLYIGFYKRVNRETDPVRLGYAADLLSYNMFYRRAALQYLHFSTRMSSQRTDPDTRTLLPVTVNDVEYMLYTYA